MSVCADCEYCKMLPGWTKVKCTEGKFVTLPVDHPFVCLERACDRFKSMDDE